jgi:DUF438 domain-containing protein
MSEHIDNSRFRKAKLKEIILKLHHGATEEEAKQELLDSLSNIPYGEVVEVEQELIEEGLPEEEVLKLCDAHSAVLHGNVDLSSARSIPPGHPVDVIIQENKALRAVTNEVTRLITTIPRLSNEEMPQFRLKPRTLFNQLMDADKHYARKEYLLFPYLEQTGVTGPPKVMWGKHDEIRELLKGSQEILETEGLSVEELLSAAEIILYPAVNGVAEMTIKEEEILLPMMMDALSDADWFEIQKQSPEIGFCLYDPPHEWKPETEKVADELTSGTDDKIRLPSGTFSNEELVAMLNTLPVDITFVDRNDKVKYFSQGSERIFQRNRAILNRDVRNCHPPASAHIVDKIIDDFRTGKQSRAPFWIRMGEKFIHIEYFAMRDSDGNYLGTLEMSHDVAGYRALEGEQRILSYK